MAPVTGTAGEWSVSGSHTYANVGSYTITVVIDGDFSPVSITSQANVAPATLTATSLAPTAETLTGSAGVTLGSSTGALVASFEQNSTENENYQATIDWGDGTTSSGTLIRLLDVLPPSVDRAFWDVYGSHAYQAPGTYSIVVTMSENGSQVSTVTSTAVITGSKVITGTPNEQFVANVYHDLLGRTVEAAGMAYWSGQLDAGMSRGQFIADIERSAEYHKDEITSLYVHYLQRAPEPAALDADANLLAGGFTDEQLAMTIVSSQEYFTLHGGTNDGFLSALFEDALQRPIEAAAKAALGQDLAAGASRAQVAFLVFGSHEYHADLVNDFYPELLDRAADVAGGAYWANQLDGGMTDEQLLANLAASEEYFGKAAG